VSAVLVWGLSGPLGYAQSTVKKTAPEAQAEPAVVEEKALAVFNKMATLLSTAPKLSVTVESGYDTVQDSGLKVEFGETRTFTIRRPDHIRLDTERRDGNQRGFRYDGKVIGVFDSEQKVYATAEYVGTIDHAFDYFIDQLQMPIPLAEVFASNLPKFTRNIEALYHVEETNIAGVRCDHIVGSTKNIDFQLWVAQGEQALPQRMILTYKREAGEPQRWAQFRNWNLAPEVGDAVFVFTPPAGAEKIPFAPRKGATETADAAPTKKGGSK
jgi:hypothetical protein